MLAKLYRIKLAIVDNHIYCNNTANLLMQAKITF